MTREEAIEIILEEKLSNYNLNEDRENNEDEVVIKNRDSMWVIYVTDERASKITGSEIKYENEKDAWDDFVERLRADKRLREGVVRTPWFLIRLKWVLYLTRASNMSYDDAVVGPDIEEGSYSGDLISPQEDNLGNICVLLGKKSMGAVIEYSQEGNLLYKLSPPIGYSFYRLEIVDNEVQVVCQGTEFTKDKYGRNDWRFVYDMKLHQWIRESLTY